LDNINKKSPFYQGLRYRLTRRSNVRVDEQLVQVAWLLLWSKIVLRISYFTQDKKPQFPERAGTVVFRQE